MTDRNEKLWRQFDQLKGLNLEQALAAGANVLMRGSKRRAPVDTGAMRDSHRVEVRPPLGDKPQVYIVVGDDEVVNYPSYVEFGTRKMAAQPFLRPALDEDRGEAIKAVGSYVLKELRTVAK